MTDQGITGGPGILKDSRASWPFQGQHELPVPAVSRNNGLVGEQLR